MINFPDVNLKDNKLIIIICVLIIILYICNYLSINILVGIVCIILFFIYYKDTYKGITKALFKKKKESLYYNNRIQEILLIIKKFKKRSPYKYRKGIKLWGSFMDSIYKLEDDRIYNYSQYFENAQLYLRESTNLFMSIGVEAKERRYIDGMDDGDFTSSKELAEISKLSKELYSEGYSFLYNLSLRLNKKWKKDKNIHNKELILDFPLPNDKKADSYDYFY